ncbi:MAG: DNA polymerase I [Bacteroidota bacterium]
MPSPQKIFLVDAMAIAYRAYYAFIQRPLINSKGQNTSAVYGFVTFLNRILTQENPDYIAVVSDTPAPTFRHKAYKDYKATREKMPEDMVSQLGLLKDVVRAYNIPLIELDGYEADDIIGTLAKRAEKEGVEVFLVTADKDFMQLISERTRMYRPARQGDEPEIVGFEEVRKKFGVAPDKVIDVLGLIGDSSDNIPGVPGIGEKTAIPLVQQYGSIEGIYENLEKILQKGVRGKLEANKDKALLSKSLVTIDTNVPIKIDFHTLKASEKDTAKLLQLFELLEFRTLLQKLKYSDIEKNLKETTKLASSTPEVPLSDIRAVKHTYTLISTQKEFDKLCSVLSSAGEFVLDTETTSRDALRADIVGMSFSARPHEAFYIPISAPEAEQATNLFGEKEGRSRTESPGFPMEEVSRRLKPILENPKTRKIGHNLKYDMLVLSQHGISLEGRFFDTMIASYALRADGQHSMDAAAREHLSYKTISYEDLTGTGKDQKRIRDVALKSVSEYSCEDADITMQLSALLKKKLDKIGMTGLCEEMEFPLVSVLARMERAGVAVDLQYLSGMSKELERQLDTLTTDIHRIAGGAFNINSTQQLGEVLFKTLKLPTVRKTKTGFSTDVGVLETLRHEHPVIEKLLDYRQLSKLKSTYVDALPQLIHPDTGRVHTSFNQTVAATGRLSSSDPNLQNIPIRTEIGRSIRKAFIPADKNSMILSADYSQVELRIMAHISGDEGLATAFRNSEDVHTTTASKVFGVDLPGVTRDMRRKAKEVNFGIMYGIGPFGLSNRLEISQAEAKEIIERYFDRFPKVKQYIGDTIENARKTGYVSTLLGRRRYLPDLRSANRNIRQNAERQAINMPIQGTAADLIKLAMVHIDSGIREGKLSSTMILQVHDELVFEMLKKEERVVRSLVEKNMREALSLSVPLEVEIGVGSNWLEAH